MKQTRTHFFNVECRPYMEECGPAWTEADARAWRQSYQQGLRAFESAIDYIMRGVAEKQKQDYQRLQSKRG